MRHRILASALVLVPALLNAQQPVRPDTIHTHGDSLPPIQVQEITVTAGAARRDDPSSSTTVTPAALRRAPVMNTYELLRQTAGLEVHDQGQGPGFASDASIRGFSSDHSTDLALWIDGVPINEPVNGHAEGYGDWSLLMPQAVRSIDLFKGPTSALYGNFALAGVVNVRTLERMTGIDAALTGGSHGRVEGSFLTGYDHDSSGGVFGARVLREDGWRPNSGYSLGQGHARVVREVGSGATLDAGLELYAARWDSPGFLTLDQFDRAKFDTVSNATDGGFKRRAQERVSLRVTRGDRMIWRSTVYATQGRWQLFLTTPPEGGSGEGSGGQTEEEDSRYGFGATTAATWSYPRAEVTVGAEGRWDHADYAHWHVTDRVRDSAQTLVGARQLGGGLFVQSLADVGRHIRLSLGGRYDLIGTRSIPNGGTPLTGSKGILSPKLGGLIHLPHAFDLYVNVSRGFRQTNGIIEDPSLPFITAWAYESGLKLDTRAVRASLALFRMDVSDEQTFDPVTLTSSSRGKSRRQGVEIDLQARLAPAWILNTDVTFTDARYRTLVTPAGDTLSGARVYNTAKYAGSAGLAWNPAGSILNGALSVNAVGPYAPFDEPGVTLDPYALVHATGGIRIGRTLMQIGIRNLLDRKYPELRAGGFVVPGQPRTVYGTVRYLW